MSDPTLSTMLTQMRNRFIELREAGYTAPRKGETIFYTDFVYSDDLFRNTRNPAYANGDYSSTGALHVALGNVDDIDILNGMSGGWSTTFRLSAPSAIQFGVNYRLTTSGYDADECGEALVAIDGVIVKELSKFCGRGYDSGWRQITILQSLDAGTHTLSL